LSSGGFNESAVVKPVGNIANLTAAHINGDGLADLLAIELAIDENGDDAGNVFLALRKR
jgi:hypothetical protein